ncbi:MAG: DUF3492 domain-containing protein [Spirochaetales bacterium]|nr:DUF3492 domain-containing protein [Spirochaetales bacterium]
MSNSSPRLRVCFVIEGSYPYVTGGVSAWVHDLIQGLEEIDFVLWTISADSKPKLRYTLPDNVVEHRNLLLTEQQAKAFGVHLDTIQLTHEVLAKHQEIFRGGHPSFRTMIETIPEGYYLSELSVTQDEYWNLIVGMNQKNNPIYPFTDYYWAWKSAHDLMFTVLGAPAPQADIYHALSTGFAGLAALAAKYRHQKRFLLTEHGLYHKEREIEIRKSQFVRGYQRDMWIKVYNRLSEVCYREADLITALFEENRQKQIELGADPSRCQVIPNGIDPTKFGVQRQPRPGYHVGLVGRVVPIKDIKTFIAAGKILLDLYDDLTVYCIGPTDEDPGYYEDCMRMVTSLKMEDRFIFTGRQNVLEYYSFLDVLMLTSIREAQPLVILEAWAAGVPVVSTEVGNVGEMLEYNTRYLSRPKDPEKLADGVRYIRENPKEAAITLKSNRKRLETLYSRNILLQAYRDLYAQARDLG